MKAYAFNRLTGFTRVELAPEVQLEAGLAAVRVASVAGPAFIGRAVADLNHVPFVPVLSVLWEANERPVVRLERITFRTGEAPVVNVGRRLFEQLMKVVRRCPALTGKDVLTVPRELRRASHRLFHVTLGPAPTLVPEDVLSRDPLKARLSVGRPTIDNHPLVIPDRGPRHIVGLLALNHLGDGVEERATLTEKEVVSLVLVHLQEEHIARVVGDEVRRRQPKGSRLAGLNAPRQQHLPDLGVNDVPYRVTDPRHPLVAERTLQVGVGYLGDVALKPLHRVSARRRLDGLTPQAD